MNLQLHEKGSNINTFTSIQQEQIFKKYDIYKINDLGSRQNFLM